MAGVTEQVASDRLHLLCARKDGLGARLSNLLWTWRLAQRIDARLLAFWIPGEPNHNEGLSAAEVLDVDRLAASPLSRDLEILDGPCKQYVRPAYVEIDTTLACDPRTLAREAPLTVRPRGALPVITTCRGPLLMQGETAAAAAAEARALFAALPPQARIGEAVEAAASRCNLEGMIALHIRRGDIVEVLRTACADLAAGDPGAGPLLEKYTGHFFKRCAPVEAYARLVQPLADQGFGILLCTDSPEMAEPFVQRFGERLILARDLAPPDLSALQGAMFELLLMSRCRRIVGTKSAFGLLAAVAGGSEFVDARFHSTPEEFVGAYARAIDLPSRDRDIHARASDAAVRNLNKIQFVKRIWEVGDADIRAVMDAHQAA